MSDRYANPSQSVHIHLIYKCLPTMFSSTDVRAERNKDAAGLGGNHILTRLYKQSEIDYMGSYLDQTNTVVSR